MSSVIFILSTVVTLGSILLLLFFGIRLVQMNISKSEADNAYKKLREQLHLLDKAVKSSVISIDQTMVERLKESGKFFQRDKEEAFVGARDRVLQLISHKDLQNLGQFVGDLDEWINNRIEFHVWLRNQARQPGFALPD